MNEQEWLTSNDPAQILEHCRTTRRSINTGPGDYGDEWLHVEEPHVRGC